MPASIGSTGLYASFTVLAVALLAVDFFMLKKEGAHTVGMREAATWSVVWVAIALAFGALFWRYLDDILGPEAARAKALEYFTGYLVEKSLAVDNVLAWIALFHSFALPAALQQRVLLYGLLGALGMRAILIYFGAILLARFHWTLYPFGVLLLATGVKLLRSSGREPAFDSNPLLRRLRHATPLFLVLVLVAATNLVFALDSIPAIFAVTRDPFIVFTSNIFAILGLRALTFLLADMARRLRLLQSGLAAILVFTGAKTLLLDVVRIPAGVALGVVGLILTVAVAASLVRPAPGGPPPAAKP